MVSNGDNAKKCKSAKEAYEFAELPLPTENILPKSIPKSLKRPLSDTSNIQSHPQKKRKLVKLALPIKHSLTKEQKLARLECRACGPCQKLIKCPEPCSCYFCKKAYERGCENKFCQKCQCKESDMLCTCTTERLLKKYEFEKGRVFGYFRCCGRRWTSGNAWIADGELMTADCRRCEMPCKPFKVTELKMFNSTSTGSGPHDQVTFFSLSDKNRTLRVAAKSVRRLVLRVTVMLCNSSESHVIKIIRCSVEAIIRHSKCYCARRSIE